MIFDIFVFRLVSLFSGGRSRQHLLPSILFPQRRAALKRDFTALGVCKATEGAGLSRATAAYAACERAEPRRRWLCPPGRSSCWGRGCTGCDTCTSDSGRCCWRMTDTWRRKKKNTSFDTALFLMIHLWFTWYREKKKDRKRLWLLFLKGVCDEDFQLYSWRIVTWMMSCYFVICRRKKSHFKSSSKDRKCMFTFHKSAMFLLFFCFSGEIQQLRSIFNARFLATVHIQQLLSPAASLGAACLHLIKWRRTFTGLSIIFITTPTSVTAIWPSNWTL